MPTTTSGGLRVAVDLRIADRPGMELTGVGRYAVEATQALCAARPDWSVDVFTNRPELVGAPNASARPTRLPTQRSAVRVGWQHLVAPLSPVSRAADCWVSMAFTLPAFLRTPAVVTIHDLVFLDQPETYAGALNRGYIIRAVRRSAQQASRIVCGSAATRSRLRDRLGVDVGKIRVVPYGVHPQFSAGDHETAPPLAPFALFVGTFEPRKGLDVLQQTLRLVNHEREDPLRLVVAGKPGWGAQDAVELLRSDPNVTFEIAPDDQRLAELYRTAAMLLFPSRGEGFGLPVAEAMASGLPVVASDLPVLREFGGDAPLWCAPGSAPAFATGAAELLADPQERHRRSRLGREAAAALTWPRVGEAVARCVEESIAASQEARRR